MIIIIIIIIIIIKLLGKAIVESRLAMDVVWIPSTRDGQLQHLKYRH